MRVSAQEKTEEVIRCRQCDNNHPFTYHVAQALRGETNTEAIRVERKLEILWKTQTLIALAWTVLRKRPVLALDVGA